MIESVNGTASSKAKPSKLEKLRTRTPIFCRLLTFLIFFFEHRHLHRSSCTSQVYGAKMPGRVSSGRPLASKARVRPQKRKAHKSAALNALELAEQQNPTRTKIQQHRLGEIDDDDERPRNRADVDERSAKRRKISLHEDEEEEQDASSDSDGNKWHTGVGKDDDDSDLDSDEAFGESDQERFADFTFRGSSKPRVSQADTRTKPRPGLREKIDLDEDVEDNVAGEDSDNLSDDDSLGPDAVDLVTAWDMNTSDDDEGSVKEKTKRKRHVLQEQEESDESDSEDVEDSIDETSQLSFSDEEDTEGQSKLVKFVQGLEAHKDVKETLDAGKGTKLSLATLLAASRDPSHRRALKVVQNRERLGPENYTGGIPGKLAPPLAKRQQDRLDRAAAYEKSKETLGKWIDTVKYNRRAEHISFPLPDPSDGTASGIKALAPTSQSAPLTSLESTIQEIMQESGLGSRKGHTADDQEVAYEELQTMKMPIEEVQVRRAELRKNRELMFREEIRARRIKKIKSKAYRRVHRKERDRELVQREGDFNSEEERERNDKIRAETRMGARHKESRWAKAVKASGRAAWDDDARNGMNERARKDEELRRRIEGRKVQGSDESGEESDESDAESEGFSESEDSRKLQRKLDQLKAQDEALPKSKLGSMAFMQRAEASRRKANDAVVDEVQKTLREEAGEQGRSSNEEEEEEVAGRTRYGLQQETLPGPPAESQTRNEFEERLSEDEIERAEVDQPVNAHPRAIKTVDMRGSSLQKTAKAVSIAFHKTDGPRPALSQPRSQPVLFLDDVTSSSGSDDEAVPTPVKGPTVTRQEDMVSMLFAGDDAVYDDFEDEKKETILEEGDQVTSTSLPGWGSWTGEGISKREQKRNARNTKTVTTVKGVAQDQRKDRNLERVIINEKRIKKNGKYLASELPHPFESRQQYERSLRLPLGPEWTTKNTFQDATKPRVLVKQGIIKPMARPMV
jgi:U3 small nucleolar RNA-associated protein 14